MNWSFAKINGRLAEIFIEEKRGKARIWGHCYVREDEYKTLKEKKWIKTDTEKYQFTYRNNKYTSKLT